MDTTAVIHHAIEWANKRLELQGEKLSENQISYIKFALSQNFTDNAQALQLRQCAVSSSTFIAVSKETQVAYFFNESEIDLWKNDESVDIYEVKHCY